MTNFTHLHNHSEYSLLDGMTTPEEMAQIVSSNGQVAAAITDHGSMGGVLRFQEAAKKQGIKSLFGIEAYYVPSLVADDLDKKAERFHLIIIAKNQEGLYKLFKLNKKAWTEGFYYKPRIEWADLKHLSGDVIVLSGCMASYLVRTIDSGDIGKAESIAKEFKSTFKDDYYLELQPWNAPSLNATLVELSSSLDIPVVGTLDCHYPTKADRGIEETLLMVGQYPSLNAMNARYAKDHALEAKGCSDLVDKIDAMYPNRFLKFKDIAVYLQSTEEVVESFKNAGYTDPALFENTMIIADKCSAEIPTKRNLLPKFSKTLKSDNYLAELAFFGLEEKGFADNKEYKDRLQEELDTVIGLGFADYFLIVWDIIKWADANDIPRGPGRGSVGGSLLAWALDITKIDSIKYGLLFSRFLNKERVSWPDIDLDFGDKHRERVKTYIKERWGKDNVASIATYIEFKPKGLVKDIARVFGAPYDQANKLTQLFETFEELRKSERGRTFLSEYPETLRVAERLEGRIKGAGVHPAGVVVSSRPLWEVCPVESRAEKKGGDRVEVISMNMNEAEDLGLLKFDILGVKAISVIDDCLKIIERRHNKNVEADSLRLDDDLVFGDISRGYTVGVFQAEASAYRNLLLAMGVQSFNDLSVSNALVRPGAFITQGKKYIACKNEEAEPNYIHESLKNVLEETFGTIVYQEQLMKVSEIIGGFSSTESDTLRRIIGKKHDAVEFEPFKEKFVQNASKFITEKQAEKVWSDLETSSTYMFNKSHAVGYSMTSYQMAWLKHYYPVEFMWALLANEDQQEQFATYLIEANRLGVIIDGPDVNISEESFTLDGDKIRFGLKNVANCGDAAIKEILTKRPFSSIDEMKNKCRKTAVKSTLYDNFEKLGAYESMGEKSEFDSKSYWLKLLNCPIYAEDNFLQGTIERIADVDVEEQDLHIIRGLVKSTKRTPKYFRVEFEDTSGSVSIFADLKMEIKNREYLLALVGAKTIYATADATTAADNFDDPFIQFARKVDQPFIMSNAFIDEGISDLKTGKSLVKIIHARYFKTKAGKMMANTWVYDPFLASYQKCVVFSEAYGRNANRFVQWSWVVVKTSLTRDQSVAIGDIIEWEEYCKLKNIAVESVQLF